MLTKQLVIACVGVSVFTLSGCASTFNTAQEDSFTCPGMPKGAICKTPIAVYKSTHGELPQSEFDKPYGAAAGGQAAQGSVAAAASVPLPAAKPTGDVTAKQLGMDPRNTQPVREPARVMRIWIAPWVEAGTDNLHWPSYIYTEIVPRKWSYGQPETGVARAPLPGPINPANVPASGSAPERTAPASAPVETGRQEVQPFE